MFYVIIAILIILIIAFCYYQNNKLDLTNYTIKSDKVKNDFIVVQLSDFHSKPIKQVIENLNKIKPDYILITGDYINDKEKNKDKMLVYGKELVKIAPVYYITGNHERRLEQFEKLMNELKEIGFTVLLNETHKNKDFAILGLDENQADFDDYKSRRNGTFEYKNMKPYFDKLEACDSFKIVLSHYPENFEKVKEMNYSQYDFDIQFSGHAHGGQFILPLIGPIFSPGQGLFPKYAKGSFGKRPMLIISRGLGNSEFPLRLFNHPEINIVKIENKNI